MSQDINSDMSPGAAEAQFKRARESVSWSCDVLSHAHVTSNSYFRACMSHQTPACLWCSACTPPRCLHSPHHPQCRRGSRGERCQEFPRVLRCREELRSATVCQRRMKSIVLLSLMAAPVSVYTTGMTASVYLHHEHYNRYFSTLTIISLVSGEREGGRET